MILLQTKLVDKAELAPLPAERCTSLEPPPPPSSAPLVRDAGRTAAVSGPATCGAAFRLPFPNGLGASDTEAHAAAALYAPDGGCFARGKLYGAGAGSCAAAPPALVAVYASAAALARGVSAGWWDGATTRLVAAEGWQPAHPRECQRWCEEAGAECGGFVVSHRVCMLRAPVGCEPALGDAPELPAPELERAVRARRGPAIVPTPGRTRRERRARADRGTRVVRTRQGPRPGPTRRRLTRRLGGRGRAR